MRKVLEVLNRIFRYHKKDFNLRLWNGTISWTPYPKFTLVIKDKPALKTLLLHPNAFTAGKLFIESQIDIEGDLFEAIKLADYFSLIKFTPLEKLGLWAKILTL